MTLTRDKELWGMALWVEKHHGSAGAEFIEAKIAELSAGGEPDGATLWQDVLIRFEQLGSRPQSS